MNNDNLRNLYKTFQKEGYDMPSYEQFEKDMQDDNNLHDAWESLKNDGYEPPEYDTFKTDMWPSQQETPQAPLLGGADGVNGQNGVEGPAPTLPGMEEGYSQEVIDRYNSPDNKAGNFKDMAQIAAEVEREKQGGLLGGVWNGIKKGGSNLIGNIMGVFRPTAQQVKTPQAPQTPSVPLLRGKNGDNGVNGSNGQNGVESPNPTLPSKEGEGGDRLMGRFREFVKSGHNDVGTPLKQMEVELLASGAAETPEDAIKKAYELNWRYADETASGIAKKTVEGIPHGFQDIGVSLDNAYYTREMQDEIKRSADSLGISYDDYVKNHLKPQIGVALRERFGYSERDADTIARRLFGHEEHATDRVIMDEANELTKGWLGDEVNKMFAIYDAKADEAYQRNYTYNPTAGAANIGSHLFAQREANKESDPDKVLESLKKMGKIIFGDLLINKDYMAEVSKKATEAGMTPEAYIEQYVAPGFVEALQKKFQETAVAREMPTSKLEYVLGGFGDSIIGMLTNSYLNSESRQQYINEANALTAMGKNPNIGDPGILAEGSRLATGMAADFWLWGGWGKIGAKATGELVGQRIASVAAQRGVSKEVARRLVEEEAAHHLGKRVAKNIMEHVPQSAITMAGAEGTTEAVRSARDGEGFLTGVGNTISTALHGGITGSAFGLTGGFMGGLTQRLSGAKRLAGKLAGLEVEAATLYTTEELSKMAQGEDAFKSPFKGLVESNIKLGFIKASANPLVTGAKLIDAIKNPVKAVREGMKGNTGTLTDEDVRDLMNTSSGQSLMDALTAMRPERTEKGMEDREGYVSREAAQRGAEAYEQYMTDPDRPFDRKQRVARLLGGIIPPPGLEVKAEVTPEEDGSYVLRTRDIDGQCVREMRFDTQDEVGDAIEQMQYDIDRNQTEALEQKVNLYDAYYFFPDYLNEEYRRAAVKSSSGEGLTAGERQAIYLYQHRDEIQEIAKKRANGRPLTDEEKQLGEIYEERFNEYAKDNDTANPVVASSGHYGRGQEAVKANDAVALREIGHEVNLADARIGSLFTEEEAQKINDVVENGTEEDVAAMIQQQTDPAKRDAIQKLHNAVETMRGVDDGISEGALADEEAIREQMTALQSESGEIIPLELSNGSTVYLTSGNPENRYGTVMVSYPGDDGEVHHAQLNVRDIESIGVAVPTEDFIAQRSQQLQQENEGRYRNWVNGTELRTGNQVELTIGGQTGAFTVDGFFGNGDVQLHDETGGVMRVSQDEAMQMIRATEDKRITEELEAERKAYKEAERQRKEAERAEAERQQREVEVRKRHLESLQAPQTPSVPLLRGKNGVDGLNGENVRWSQLGDTGISLSDKEGVEKHLAATYPTEEEARSFIEDQRQALKVHQRDDVQPRIDKWKSLLDDYVSGKREYTDEELSEMLTSLSDLETEQAFLNDQAKALKGIQESLKTPQSPLLRGAAGRMSALSKARSREDKIRIGRELYGSDDMTSGLFDDLDVPRDAYELVSMNLGYGSINWEGLERGGHHVRGLQEELGVSRGIGRGKDSNGFNAYLAKKGEGKGVEEIVHAIWESPENELPDGGKRFDDSEIRNAMLDLLMSAGKPTDIRDYVIDQRLNEAEAIMREAEEREKEYELEAQAGGVNGTDGVNGFSGRLANAIEETNTEPTDSQKEAGSDVDGGAQGRGVNREQVIEVPNLNTIDKNNIIPGQVYVSKKIDAQGYTTISLGKVGVNSKGKAVFTGQNTNGAFVDISLKDLLTDEDYNDYLGEESLIAEDLNLNAHFKVNEIKIDPNGNVVGKLLIPKIDGGYEEITARLKVNPIEYISKEQLTSNEIEVLQKKNETPQAPESNGVNGANGFSGRLAKAIEETNTEPTDGQKEAGNYKKGHLSFGGYQFTIENPKGSVRSGKDASGNPWSVTMHNTYGYLTGKGHLGKDGDHLDVFINDDADLDKFGLDGVNGLDGQKIYIIDQVKKDGSFDEHKIMYGFDSEVDAIRNYLLNYSRPWHGLGNITGVDKATFDKWVESSDRKVKPFAETRFGDNRDVAAKVIEGIEKKTPQAPQTPSVPLFRGKNGDDGVNGSNGLDENNGSNGNDGSHVPVLDKSDYKTYMTPEAKEYFANDPRFAKLAHRELAFVTAAVWDGVVIPVEELMKIPEIQEAEKRINSKKGSLNINESEQRKHIDHLLDAEHGSQVYKDGKKVKNDYSGPVRQERKAMIVIGRPAGGKSSVFADRLSHDYGARIVDSDIVKPWLEGYDEGYGAGYVQEASAKIAEQAIFEAAKRGDNMVIPRIGGKSVIGKTVIPLIEMGYDVQLYYNDVSEQTSIMRAASRFVDEGRYLSLQYLTTIKDKISKTFSNFAEKKLGEYYDEKDSNERSSIRDVRVDGLPVVDGGSIERGTEPSGRRTGEAVSPVVQGRGRDGRNQAEQGDEAIRREQPIFSYVEWKSNDVAFGEKPKEIWNSESGKPLPGQTQKGEPKVEVSAAPSVDQGEHIKQAEVSQGKYEITKRFHKKKGTDIDVVNFTERFDREKFLELKKTVKDFGGYYSSYGRGGFVFENGEEAARRFAEAVTGDAEATVIEQPTEPNEEEIQAKQAKADRKTVVEALGKRYVRTDEKGNDATVHVKYIDDDQVEVEVTSSNPDIEPTTERVSIEDVARSLRQGDWEEVKPREGGKRFPEDGEEQMKEALNELHDAYRNNDIPARAKAYKKMWELFDARQEDEGVDLKTRRKSWYSYKKIVDQQFLTENSNEQTTEATSGTGEAVVSGRDDVLGLDASGVDGGVRPEGTGAVVTGGEPERKPSSNRGKSSRNGRKSSEAGQQLSLFGDWGDGTGDASGEVRAESGTRGEDLGGTGEGGSRQDRGRSVAKKEGTGEEVAVKRQQTEPAKASTEPAQNGTEPAKASTEPEKKDLNKRADDGSVKTATEKARPLNTRNYLYPKDASDIDNMSPRERLNANVRALEILRDLMRENRPGTPEEIAEMGRFRGWGGIKDVESFYDVDWLRRMDRRTGEGIYGRLADVIDELDPDGKRGLLDNIRRSALTSYYTPTDIARAINHFLDKAGFKGGDFLDGSYGVGVLEGTMPKGMQQRTQIHGVELDWLTGQLAKHLYPDADIKIMGFQDVDIADNSMDVVGSNIPFGDIEVFDKKWKNNSDPTHKIAQKRIHNYYVVSKIDKTKPGGLLYIMTSNAVMDTPGNKLIREYIADQCEILGAVRLPDNTFKGAGTKVVTDVLFLRKFKDAEDRARTLKTPSVPLFRGKNGDNGVNGSYESDVLKPFLGTADKKVTVKGAFRTDEVTVRFNGYYGEHPEMMLGEVKAGGQYRGDEFGLTSDMSTSELAKQMEKLIDKKIVGERAGKLLDTHRTERKVMEAVRESYVGDGNYVSNGNLIEQNGRLGMLETQRGEGGEIIRQFVEVPGLKKDAAKIKTMIPLRTALKKLISEEIGGADDATLSALRADLRRAYDQYTRKYGKLHDKGSNYLDNDIDGFTLRSLEKWKDGKFIGLSDIFEKSTIKPKIDASTIKTPSDAVTVSLAEYGEIRESFLRERLGDNWQEQCEGVVFAVPFSNGRYEIRDLYLSGDVKSKLVDAERAAAKDPSYQKNVDALKEVQPKDIPFIGIGIHMGARWVPDKVYTEFIWDLLGVDGRYDEDGANRNTGIRYLPEADVFTVSVSPWETSGKANEWHTTHRKAEDLIDCALKNDKTKVQYTVDGQSVFDAKETEQANDKIQQIREKFEEWLPQNRERVEELAKIYNDKFNRTVIPHFDGSHLQVPGLQGMELRPHQKDAVWMLINNRGGIIDHIVGAGKTLVMQCAIMEMRRMGIAKKPMIIALKSTVPQIKKEFLEAFPAARVLAPSEKDFTTKNRKKILSQIALNDWDCVILSHENYGMLPHTEEVETGVIREQLDQLDASIHLLMEQRDQSDMTKRQKKALEKRRQRLENKMSKLLDRKVDREFTFENLGVDYLFVDECQQFKSLPYTTTHQNVAGLASPEGSSRATALLCGARYLQQMHQGDMGLTLLSGTTISNSLVELYSLLQYVRPNKMASLGFNTFDAWASNFAVNSAELEYNHLNELATRSRFRNFDNLPELSKLYTEVADVRNDNNLELPKPKMKVHVVTVPATDALSKITDECIRMCKQKDGSYFGIPSKTASGKDQPWSLLATNISTKAAINVRLVDPSLEDVDGGKIKMVCDNVKELYDKFSPWKGTQMIFCDLGVPGEGKEYDVYNDIIHRLTTEYGIPREEIVDIHVANTDKKKEELFKKMNNGDVRVLIAGAKNGGTGVNVQQRMVGIHHVDMSWNPANITQENGRGARQGNWLAKEQNDNQVEVFYYATENSLDLYKYQLVDQKQKMIDRFKTSTTGDEREFKEEAGEDGDFDAAAVVAMLSGNPIILEKAKQDKKVEKLIRAKRQYDIEYDQRKHQYESDQRTLTNFERLVTRNAEDRKVLAANGFVPDKKGVYPATVKVVAEVPQQTGPISKTFDKPGEAGQFIHELMKNNAKVQLEGFGMTADIVFEIGGELFGTKVVLRSPSGIRYDVDLSDSDVAAGTSLRRLLQKVVDNAEKYRSAVEQYKHKLEGGDPGEKNWPKQAELDEALAKKKELDEEYKKLQPEEETPQAPLSRGDEVRKAGRNPQPRQEGAITDEQVEQLNRRIALQEGRQQKMEEIATEAVMKVLDGTGVPYHVISQEEAQRVLAMAKDGVSLSKGQKRAAETASLIPKGGSPADISTTDGAKILKKLESFANKLEKVSNVRKKFIDEAGIALEATQDGSNSWYNTFVTPNGQTVTIRLGNHNAKVSNFDYRGEDNGISIVISKRSNEGIINNGNAHIVEFFYPEIALRKAYGKPLADIVRSIKESLLSGEYKDTTGLAEREEVNISAIQFLSDKQPLITSKGVVYGFTDGKDVYLTGEGINPETPAHEFGHLWVKAVKAQRPDLWENIKSLMKEDEVSQKIYQKLLGDENYQKIHGDEDELYEEVLTNMSGQKNRERFEQAAREVLDEAESMEETMKIAKVIAKIRSALSKLWHWIGKDLFKIKKFRSVDEVTDRMMYDFLTPQAQQTPSVPLFRGKVETPPAPLFRGDNGVNGVNMEFQVGKGKPRQKKGEGMASYFERLRAWERRKLAEEDENDPMPVMPEMEGIEDFDEMARIQKEYKKLYEDWEVRHGLRDIANAELGLYDVATGKTPQAPLSKGDGGDDVLREQEIDARVMQDIGDATGFDTTPEGARKLVKYAVYKRRNTLESSNAEDAIFVHDLGKRIDEIAKHQGVTPKELREALPHLIEDTYGYDRVHMDDGSIEIVDVRDQMPIKKTAEVKQLLSDIKDWYDEFYHVLEDAGLRDDAGYIAEGYVNHIWDKAKSDPKAWEEYVENYQRTKSPNMKHREIPTYAEGIDVGLVPKFTDITDIMSYYSRSNNEAVANRKLLDDLAGINVDETNANGEVTRSLPLLTNVEPSYFDKDAYSKPYEVPGVGNVWVHKAEEHEFNPVYGPIRQNGVAPWLTKIAHHYDILGSMLKKINLSFSGFHHLALTETGLAQMGFREVGRFLIKDMLFDSLLMQKGKPAFVHRDDFLFAAKHLVQLGATSDYAAADVQAITTKLRDAVRDFSKDGDFVKKIAGYGLMPITETLDVLNKGMDTILWDYVHDGLKIRCMRTLKKQIDSRAAKMGFSDDVVEKLYNEAGQYVNDIFGGQYWELINISPATLKWAGRFMMSPDWTVSSMIRQPLAITSFGSLYSEQGFQTWLKYHKDNVKRLFGKDIPHDEFRRLRSYNGKRFWLLNLMKIIAMIALINTLKRRKDEADEREKADEIRKSVPNYRSSYELAYPDGMKWYDYTMYGNTIGQQTHLFLGRYKDGSEWYARWGKQFRELPELFIGRHGVDFPAPFIDRIVGKMNPIARYIFIDLPGASGAYNFNTPYEVKEDVAKHGKTIAILSMTAKHFLPYSVPLQADKEFKWLDLMMPSQKGFTSWKAVDFFKTFINAGDMHGIERTYHAAVMNGLNAEECLDAAISSVKATQRKELADGVTDLQSAFEKFDGATTLSARQQMRKKIIQYLASEDYKAYSRADALEKARSFMEGEDVAKVQKDNDKYVMSATSEDIRDDWKMDALYKKSGEMKKQLHELEDSGKDTRRWVKAFGTWLNVRDILNDYRKEVRDLKKQLGEGNDEKVMKEIRQLRQKTMKEIDKLSPPEL